MKKKIKDGCRTVPKVTVAITSDGITKKEDLGLILAKMITKLIELEERLDMVIGSTPVYLKIDK